MNSLVHIKTPFFLNPLSLHKINNYKMSLLKNRNNTNKEYYLDKKDKCRNNYNNLSLRNNIKKKIKYLFFYLMMIILIKLYIYSNIQ